MLNSLRFFSSPAHKAELTFFAISLKLSSSTEHNIEKMINLFEEGIKLSESCEKKIEEYKNKINTIISENNKELT